MIKTINYWIVTLSLLIVVGLLIAATIRLEQRVNMLSEKQQQNERKIKELWMSLEKVANATKQNEVNPVKTVDYLLIEKEKTEITPLQRTLNMLFENQQKIIEMMDKDVKNLNKLSEIVLLLPVLSEQIPE